MQVYKRSWNYALCIITTLLFSFQSVAQSTNNSLKKEASTMRSKNPLDFLPEGYVIYTEAYQEPLVGDLNKDGLDDVILFIKGTDTNNIIQHEYRGELDRNRRGIIILLNKGDYYQLALQNHTLFYSENEDGGVYYAPELSLSIHKGNLIIHYAHGRYGNWSYTFRYQNSDWELIGYDNYYSRGPVPQTITSINFSTKKMCIQDNLNKDQSGDDYVEKFKETWYNINIKERVRLSEIVDLEDFEVEKHYSIKE